MSDVAGHTVTEVAPRSVAAIGAFADRARLLDALRAEFGVTVPVTPAFVRAGEVMLACLAPARFLASAGHGAALPERLADRLAGLAAVTDQSDMWVAWRLSGPAVRDVLARVVPVDLHPAAFRVGDLALTSTGHADVRLFRVEEDAYELAVLRSYAADFRQTLEKRCKTH